MSFSNIKYTSNAGSTYKMRISSDKADLAGDGTVTAAVTDPKVRVLVKKNRLKAGIRARGVTFSKDTAVTGGKVLSEYVFIPAVTPAVQTDLLSNETITYKGATWGNPTAVEEA